MENDADPIAKGASFRDDDNSRSIDNDIVAEPLGPSLYAEGNIDYLGRDTWTPKKEKILASSFDYIASNPGKEFRTLLLSAFNTLLEVPPESLAIITEVIRILHTASLLIDDIEDNSDQRRGKPTAHKVFGLAQTINTANYKYFVALKELAKLQNPARAIDIFTVEMLQLHRGQGMELFWRDTLTCPTEEDYLEMASNKTGGLFRLAVKLMQSESLTAIDCMPLVQLLGLIFQIVDDYKNLASADYAQGKGSCEDLTEGKFSFPILHSIRSNPTNLQLLHILQQRPTDVEMKRCAVAYISSTHSLDYTKSVVGVLIDRARKSVEELYPPGKKSWEIHMLLDKLALN